MLSRLKWWCCVMACSLFPVAHAALTLQLTQGVRAALPIAIVPLAGENMAMVAGDTTLSKVISQDLTNSGQFHVITPGLLDPRPSTAQQLQVKRWQKKGANDIVLGRVMLLGRGRYRVTVQLFNLYDAKRVPLLDVAYTVGAGGLRGLAHHISDEVYQKLTGSRGIFSTKVAYILLQHHEGAPDTFSLEVADADGFRPQTLLRSTQPIMSPTWMPNAQSLAYVSFEGHESAIYLQNIYTGARQLVSRFPGINGAPAFSPDGKKLALVLSTTGDPKIYVLDLPTRRLRQITFGYAIDTEPAWAPDQQSLIFTSNRGGSPQIYRYTFANQRIERLTFDGNYNAHAQFLPDGQHIVMMHREKGAFGIATQDLDSGFVQDLTSNGRDESPTVAPNGKMVIYDRPFHGPTELAAVSINGQIQLRLPAREGNVQEPAWSPFLTG